jgi:hypothetical protein
MDGTMIEVLNPDREPEQIATSIEMHCVKDRDD